jgi:hypothetical protein
LASAHVAGRRLVNAGASRLLRRCASLRIGPLLLT